MAGIEAYLPFNSPNQANPGVVSFVRRVIWNLFCISILPVALPIYMISSLYNGFVNTNINDRQVNPENDISIRVNMTDKSLPRQNNLFSKENTDESVNDSSQKKSSQIFSANTAHSNNVELKQQKANPAKERTLPKVLNDKARFDYFVGNLNVYLKKINQETRVDIKLLAEFFNDCEIKEDSIINVSSNVDRDVQLMAVSYNCWFEQKKHDQKSQEKPKQSEHAANHNPAMQKPEKVHSRDSVSLSRYAGIQARNNNCGLAAFFVAVSNKGVLNKLIKDAEEKVSTLSAEGKQSKAENLQQLVIILKKFNLNGNLDHYIPDEGLNEIRSRYNLKGGQLGEVLEPEEFIRPILGDIYDCDEGAIRKNPLKAPMCLLDLQSNCKTLSTGVIKFNPSKDCIEEEKIPVNLKLRSKKDIKHQFLDVVGSHVSNYCDEKDCLKLKYTEELHHENQEFIKRKTFEYINNDDIVKKVTMDLENNGDDYFVRSKEIETIDRNGKITIDSQRVAGMQQSSNGTLTTIKQERVDDVTELVNIYIDSVKDDKSTNNSIRQHLPADKEHCPEVLFVTIPSFGAAERYPHKWRKDVLLPAADGTRTPYEVSAVMSISLSHYVAWNLDKENGLIYYADSMGDVTGDDENSITIPTIITMPDRGTQKELEDADKAINSTGVRNGSYQDVAVKFQSLDKQAAVLVLKKK